MRKKHVITKNDAPFFFSYEIIYLLNHLSNNNQHDTIEKGETYEWNIIN